MSDKRKKINTNTITKIALFSALLCIISPFALVFPFSPVPISLATLMLYISVYILGTLNAVISCGIYLLIGLVGIPVFSGFTGGVGKVLGPTGGYLIGYLFLIFISGWFVNGWSDYNRKKVKSSMEKEGSGKYGVNYIVQGFGMLLGTIVCYLFGSFWLAYQAGMEFKVAFCVGAIPFIPGDIMKIVLGVLIGSYIKKRLIKAGVL